MFKCRLYVTILTVRLLLLADYFSCFPSQLLWHFSKDLQGTNLFSYLDVCFPSNYKFMVEWKKGAPIFPTWLSCPTVFPPYHEAKQKYLLGYKSPVVGNHWSKAIIIHNPHNKTLKLSLFLASFSLRGLLAGPIRTTSPSGKPAWTSSPAGLAPCRWSTPRWDWTPSSSRTRSPSSARNTGTSRGSDRTGAPSGETPRRGRRVRETQWRAEGVVGLQQDGRGATQLCLPLSTLPMTTAPLLPGLDAERDE